MLMHQRRQILLASVSAVCFASALALLVSVGLPERADFTSLVIEETRTAPEMGSLAPDFSATLLNGESFRLSGLRGQVIVLNFWATWCAPCEIEMPELDRLASVYGDQNVRVIAINTGEPIAAIEAWRARLQLSLDILPDIDLAITRQYQVRGQPMTLLIGADGVIAHIYYGLTQVDTLAPQVAALLQNP